MFILRPYQSAAVSAFWSFLRGQSGNPVIVLPTGAGKSLVIAQVCHDAVKRFNGKVIVLAHRKELLSQNADKIRRLAPDLDIGIYSAGLRKRDGLEADVCVAGIQSIFKKAYNVGQRHLVLIDEVHLVPRDGEGMYQHFLSELRSANERVRLGGLTATPFRLDCGPLCRPDGIFHKVCYSAPITDLIDGGYLCRLTTKPAAATVDTSKLHLRAASSLPAKPKASSTRPPTPPARDRRLNRRSRQCPDLLLGRATRNPRCLCNRATHDGALRNRHRRDHAPGASGDA